ncbi:ABC transporter permease [Candidatus Woesearchaeota archaeon]|nr:ABC transporter permease [Candidatus Woesearchaeota archaeon]
MRIDEIKYSLENLKHRGLRSFLTILSIVIGIASIFALMSFGMGIGEYIEAVAEEAGSDKLFIQAKGIGAPGTDDNFFLLDTDVDFVGKINGVKEASGVYMKTAEIEHGKDKKFAFIMGANPDDMEFVEETFVIKIDKGRTLKKGDMMKAVLGYSYQFDNKFFKKAIKVGDKIGINKEIFEVIGFYDELGNPQDDSNIYITFDAMEELYPETKDKFGFVIIRSEKSEKVSELADRIQERLRKEKGQEKGKEDFFVTTFEDALATFSTIIGVLNGILLLIALISVIVASVNIMNTMYTAVLERTKEIGIMKAVGARNSDILWIFVFESGFIGMTGGILGVLLGYVISATIGGVTAAAGFALLQPVYPLYLTLGCIIFSFSIGAVSGIMPALQASKLRPSESLRYE